MPRDLKNPKAFAAPDTFSEPCGGLSDVGGGANSIVGCIKQDCEYQTKTSAVFNAILAS